MSMIGELKYCTFNIGMGWLGTLGSAKGLLCVTLPQHSIQDARRLLGDRVNHATWSPHWFEDLIERFGFYFSGHKVDFPDELDLSAATSFQRKVWETTRLVPYGETRSYAWVAEQIRKPAAARAVGQALAGNPLPVIIPCHRVLRTDGNLGGYSGGLGLETKKQLLSLETSASIR